MKARSPEQVKISYYEMRLNILLREAKADGVVITVDLEPTQPLRIGGYRMVGKAREAREMAK